jgi:hypothetical protein
LRIRTASWPTNERFNQRLFFLTHRTVIQVGSIAPFRTLPLASASTSWRPREVYLWTLVAATIGLLSDPEYLYVSNDQKIFSLIDSSGRRSHAFVCNGMNFSLLSD